MRFLIATCVLCALAFGQDTTAVLEGVVTDPSGAVIKGASVKASNDTNGYTRTQQVGASGGYHLILPAGQYELVIAAPGFAAYRVRSVALSLSQTVRLDAQLQVEKQVQGVEVSAVAPLIETSNAIGNVVTGR